ncbi:MAG TPA: plasmid pRiA4b ORF-3 family protein [Veillonellaceae bacterium]|nr:plasmid pRiA4b ORF-3 family protein [Veillonellaceae bacterium]
MAEIYSFHVAVRDMEDKIWRDIDISGKSTLAQLAYTILVVFQTRREHLFCLYYKGKRYELRFDPDGPKASRPNRVYLEKMKLALGDELTMIYDYGCNWEFQITFKGTRPMELGKGNHYPNVSAGAGVGIVEDMFPGQLLELIEEEDRTGEPQVPSPYNDKYLRSYKLFDLKSVNYGLTVDVRWAKDEYEHATSRRR